MNVYSFIDTTGNYLANQATIKRSQQSFESAGFKWFMLNAEHARKHYLWPKICRMVDVLPSLNSGSYELACWSRWLAYEGYSPALFVDWDCLNVSLTPDHGFEGFEITALNDGNPCAVYDGGFGIERFVSRFSEAYEKCRVINDKSHCGDICLFEKLLPSIPQWNYRRICYDYDHPNLCEARIIHFGNNNVKPEHRFENRWQAMDEYLRSK